MKQVGVVNLRIRNRWWWRRFGLDCLSRYISTVHNRKQSRYEFNIRDHFVRTRRVSKRTCQFGRRFVL